MFTVKNSIKNIGRHWKRSVLYIIICLVAVITLQVYLAGIDRTDAQLHDLSNAMPIAADVTSVDASKYEGLQIRSMTVDGLLESHFVRDLKMNVLLRATEPGATDKEKEYPGIYITGVNSDAALEGLNEVEINWLYGYDASFFEGGELACVMDTSYMAARGLSVGDTVPLDTYYYIYGKYGELSFGEMGRKDIRIVGETDMIYVQGVPTLIMPYTAARQLLIDNEIQFQASAASFYVNDALNLNDFKTEMRNIALIQADFSGQLAQAALANQGTALMLNDAAYISGATRLQESLSLLRGFLPVVIVVLAIIGYFVAYLMIQSRRVEYSVLRLLGVGRGQGFRMYFLEMAVMTIGGSLCGVIVALPTGICEITTAGWVFLLFDICFMGGSVVALWRLSRTNVMLALAQAE